jgi:predicted transcriptional regulator of viral defense system
MPIGAWSDTPNVPTDARSRIAALAREATGGVFDVAGARRAWGTADASTRARLRSLEAHGWIRRLRRGVYLLLPLDVERGGGDVVEDSWILAERVFAPCYVGGWSAAHHWGLTEQLFRTTFVVTSTSVRSSSVTIAESEFRVAKVATERVARGSVIWRGQAKVRVSDRELTIVDGLADRSWVGGLRQLAEIVRAYHRGDAWRSARLLARLGQLDRGAAFKRLGYLAETVLDPVPEESWAPGHPARPPAPPGARGGGPPPPPPPTTAGLIALDPAVRSRGRILKRWGLRVNVPLEDLRSRS